MLTARWMPFYLFWVLFAPSCFAVEVFRGGTEPLLELSQRQQQEGTVKGQIKKEIKIAGSEALLVQISGALHPQEILRVYDMLGKKTGYLQRTYQGDEVKYAKPFVVKGDDLLITLNSDAPNAVRPGVTVQVEPYRFAKVSQPNGLKKVFEGGTHKLVLRKVDYLYIPHNEFLKVYVQGGLHAEESLRIYQMQGKKVGEKIYERTGDKVLIGKTLPLIAKGDQIKITLNSKDNNSIRPGITVTVDAYSANDRIRALRQQSSAEIQQLAQYEVAGIAALLEREITALEDLNRDLSKLDKPDKTNQIFEDISKQFQSLSGDYDTIAQRQKQLEKRAQQSLRVLLQAEKKLQHYIEANHQQQKQMQARLENLSRRQHNAKTGNEFNRLEWNADTKKSHYKRLQVQENMWQESLQIYRQLSKKLKHYIRTLADFRFMLAQQSEIYQNHAKILLRDMSLLDTHVGSLEKLSKQLQALDQAWRDVVTQHQALLVVSH